MGRRRKEEGSVSYRETPIPLSPSGWLLDEARELGDQFGKFIVERPRNANAGGISEGAIVPYLLVRLSGEAVEVSETVAADIGDERREVVPLVAGGDQDGSL
jgi:hypothetical protein